MRSAPPSLGRWKRLREGKRPPIRVTIFTNAQAVIRRIALEEPGPGQMYALQARKHIVVLWRARPDTAILLGPGGGARNAAPRSLAHLERETCEKKWAEDGAGPPGSTRCRAGRSRTARLLVTPRGLPRGSVS